MAIVIVGAGGHGREIHDVVAALAIDFVGFVADGNVDHDLIAPRGPYLGGVVALERIRDVQYVIGIGDAAARKRIDDYLRSLALEAAVLVHPAAIVGTIGVTLGPGTVLCAGAQVTTNSTLGRHVHLNRAAQVGHDCNLGDYATLHPGSVVSGGVTLGEGATLGTNSCVIPGKTVGAWATVGAGASVVSDIVPGVVAVGVPARAH